MSEIEKTEKRFEKLIKAALEKNKIADKVKILEEFSARYKKITRCCYVDFFDHYGIREYCKIFCNGYTALFDVIY